MIHHNLIVFCLGLHPCNKIKLERYRENYHRHCARMTRTNRARFIFFIIIIFLKTFDRLFIYYHGKRCNTASAWRFELLRFGVDWMWICYLFYTWIYRFPISNLILLSCTLILPSYFTQLAGWILIFTVCELLFHCYILLLAVIHSRIELCLSCLGPVACASCVAH